MSDGFYESHSNFAEDITNVCQTSDAEFALERLFRQYSDYQADDSTVLIARRNEIPQEIAARLQELSLAELTDRLPKFQLTPILSERLSAAIKAKDEASALHVLAFMNSKKLLPSAEELDEKNREMKLVGFLNGKVLNGIVSLIKLGQK